MNRVKAIIIPILILLLAVIAAPSMLPFTGGVNFSGDYRIPYDLGEDYFLYERYSEYAGYRNRIPVIGDSVIWGHYTDGSGTLSANLNRLTGSALFANMGLDGIHPAAMNGLVNCYAADLGNKKIVVGINLLWMSSPRHDLSGEINSEINHKILLAQFYPRIPSYAPTIEERFRSVVTRSVSFFSWLDHIRMNRLAGKSLYLWTLDNPREDISGYFTAKSHDYRIPGGIEPEKMQQQTIEWVTPERSLQWRFMLDTLSLLKKRGNRVAAVITPFNTHMMTDESREKYFLMLAEMEWILRENGIIPVLPPVLDRKYFADSSHPNAEGYRLIAGDMMQNREFIDFINQ